MCQLIGFCNIRKLENEPQLTFFHGELSVQQNPGLGSLKIGNRNSFIVSLKMLQYHFNILDKQGHSILHLMSFMYSIINAPQKDNK